MNENSRPVDMIVSISSQVAATVHHHAFPTGGGQSLGDYQAGKARADDQEIGGTIRFQEAAEIYHAAALGRSLRSGGKPG